MLEIEKKIIFFIFNVFVSIEVLKVNNVALNFKTQLSPASNYSRMSTCLLQEIERRYICECQRKLNLLEVSTEGEGRKDINHCPMSMDQ